MGFPMSKQQRKKLPLDAIDDVDEPPNHETLQAYIGHLDTFMKDVRANPHTLKKRVAKLRSTMASTDSGDSGTGGLDESESREWLRQKANRKRVSDAEKANKFKSWP